MNIPISELVNLINQLPDKNFIEVGYQFKIFYREKHPHILVPYSNFPEEGKKIYTEFIFSLDINKAKEKEWHFIGIE